MKLAIVVPVYNEQDGLESFYMALRDVMMTLNYFWQVLFVDDGSEDNSWSVIQKLSTRDPKVKGIRLSRNFGHQTALAAGLTHISADAVITMDADLQHPPDLIPQLVAQWQQGYAVVNTIRLETDSVHSLKRYSSAIFYRLINLISEVPITPGGADFRLLSETALQALQSMPERQRFLRGMVSWIGFSQTAIPFVPRPRQYGQSKYTWRKMMHLGLNGLTSFSIAPLRLSLLFGVMSIAVALLYAIYVLGVKVFSHTAQPGWASIIGIGLFFGGVQLFSLGILGEYLGHVFAEVKHRPLFFVQETAGIMTPTTSNIPAESQ
ncbi:glycosyltransferase family 2 protein [Sulfobacillus sp. hq2]|uniref:glycosyltransferase family 2 protein n=1 Tax=Sulfobacillus TaxID=28033 RepID=UPI000CD13D98|nr:glycosyltransferase family 2 protein [Sulfobacillus sp. hq2]POB10453.1 glycosyltransferase [Sulfobacillus sp. hq2]